jgi:hypothetical protein
MKRHIATLLILSSLCFAQTPAPKHNRVVAFIQRHPFPTGMMIGGTAMGIIAWKTRKHCDYTGELKGWTGVGVNCPEYYPPSSAWPKGGGK